jgi:hypothetical protein
MPGMWNQLQRNSSIYSHLTYKPQYQIPPMNFRSTVLMSRTALDGFLLKDIEKDFMLELIKIFSIVCNKDS